LTTTVEPVYAYIGRHPEPKRADLYILYVRFTSVLLGEQVSFFDGLDDNGKVVAKPTLDY